MRLTDGKVYHIACAPGDVGRYVLLPGDPFRTDVIASYLDDAVLVAHNREHKTWTGTLLGEKVSVTSTGMGRPSTAIEYPAVADRHVVAALADAADALGYNFIEGITHSKDSFYSQFEPDIVPATELMKKRLEMWRRGDVVCCEMEAAAIFVISSIRGYRRGHYGVFRCRQHW